MRAKLLILLLALLAAPALLAQTGYPVWCEVHVDLGKDGRSSVEYTVKYQQSGGEFHGFFFHGPQIDSLHPVWDDAFGLATLSNGRTLNRPMYRLSIGSNGAS